MQIDFYQMILFPPVYRVAVPQDVEKVSGLTLGSSEPELCIGVCETVRWDEHWMKKLWLEWGL